MDQPFVDIILFIAGFKKATIILANVYCAF